MLHILQKKTWVIHPLLFSIIPILYLYTSNREDTPVSQVLIPMGFAIAASFLIWLLLSILLRNIVKAGLATSIFIFLFFSYGHLYDLLVTWDIYVPKHGHLLPAILLIFGYSIYFIKQRQSDFKGTTKALNLMALIIIVINLITLAASGIGQRAETIAEDLQLKDGQLDVEESPVSGSKPDIYFIILDEYASLSTITEYYNYDNSQFAEFLEENGYFIANNSKTSFWVTWYVLASIFNMEYQSLADSEKLMWEKISNNKVVNLLKSLGYKYVHIGSWIELGRWEPDYDIYINHFELKEQVSFVGEFAEILWNTTMMRPFYNYITQEQNLTFYRDAMVSTLQDLNRMPDIEGPKFVFAHLSCPHTPFVFGPNGEYIDSINHENWEDKQYYLGQYIYITKEMERTVRELIDRSSTPPIIILQSDHGPRAMMQAESVRNAIGFDKDEWAKIFNAFYTPGISTEVLHDSISNVNTFIIVFNEYFGTDFDLLEDE